MRKLILMMQVTVDGFIDGPGGDMSWMKHDDPEHWADVFEMLQTVDLLLLGRVMWPDYRNYWKQALDSNSASANEKKYAQFAEKTKHLVFSNTLQDAGWQNTSIVNDPVVETIRRLKKENGKDIQVVGGAKLAATVIDAGLVDEYRLNIHPAIIGSGKSFFRDQHSKQILELLGIKTLSSGVIIASYRAKAR